MLRAYDDGLNRVCRWLSHCLVSPPAVRGVVNVLFAAVPSLLGGLFVAQITTPSGLAWEKFDRVGSFYALILVIVLNCWYQRAVYSFDNDVQNFMDGPFIEAYMRKRCLPAFADYWAAKIRKGEFDELEPVNDMLKKVLKW